MARPKSEFTRRDLVTELAHRLEIDLDFAKTVEQEIESIIQENLESGVDVTLFNFLKFEIKTLPPKKIYSFVYQDKVVAPARYNLKVSAIGNLKKRIKEQEVSLYERRKLNRGLIDDADSQEK